MWGVGGLRNIPESEFLKQRTGCSAPEFLRQTGYLLSYLCDINTHTQTDRDGHDNALLIIDTTLWYPSSIVQALKAEC
eukprot:scaffold7949_cov37-Cyclotella_meneghiniana.AAC.8